MDISHWSKNEEPATGNTRAPEFELPIIAAVKGIATEYVIRPTESEDPAEFFKDLVDVRIPEDVLVGMGLSEAVPGKGAETPPQTIILLPLLRIRKNRIRFIDLLHQFLTARIFIWMIAECKIAIGFLYFAGSCGITYAQYLVIVFPVHASIIESKAD